MIRDFLAAVAFLTRLPIGPRFEAADIGRSMRWFPLVGALIGAIQSAALILFRHFFPPLVSAALVIALEVVLTGALHLDGLADSADGFGGGRTREDVLRIMRDHYIGAYGATALVICLSLKVALVSALIDQRVAVGYLVLAPTLGRWAAVALSAALPYARVEKGASTFVGRTEWIIATITMIAVTGGIARWRGAAASIAVTTATLAWGFACRRRIGGVTGDTLGAGVEIAETLTLLVGAARLL